MRDFTPGRVICLFGCGGDRKAPSGPVWAVAGALADVAVVTSDNPRTEVPMDIINDILPGLEGAPAGSWWSRPSRRHPAGLCLGDTVVLAVRATRPIRRWTVEYHLDEREEIAAYFA
ncbi:MAG: glutamate ligase domain-containing protein [Flavonifractor plautii]